MDINRKAIIKVLVGSIIVIGSILSFTIKFVAHDAELSVDRPSFIRVAPDNTLSLLIGNSLYFIDERGTAQNVFDLDDYGLNIRGDYDFFSNGDLLIYSSHEQTSFSENLLTFIRIKESRQKPASGKDGLYRCSKNLTGCQLFTDALPAFYTTFRVFIDRASDTVYIADTPRFTLYKLNSQGALLARNDSKLHFPNQILLHEDKLYIANTNYNAIKIVRSETESFGEKISSHKAIISDSGSYLWPSEIIRTPDSWWLGIADSNMDYANIQRFDDDWEKQDVPLLKDPDADARSLVLFGDQVWVTDWSNLKIYRFDLSGNRLADFTNDEIHQVFTQSNQLIKKYQTLSNNGLIAFFIIFSIGIVAAFVLEKNETLNYIKGQGNDTDDSEDTGKLENPPGADIYWIENKFSKGKNLITIIAAVALIIVGTIILPMLAMDASMGWETWFIIFSFYPVMGLLVWVFYKMSKTRIGVSGELLLVDDGQGNIGIGKESLIQYNATTLVVNNVIALLGQPHSPLYPKKELQQWVKPRMLRGDSVSSWTIFKIMWQHKHPSVILTIGIIVYFSAILSVDGI